MTASTELSDFVSRALPIMVAADRNTFVENAQGSERLIVTLDRVQPRMRGCLAEAIFDAIECTLREHGATPIDRLTNADFNELLRDQIYRAGLLGASGIALEITDLSAIADLSNTLHAEDGITLIRWVEATHGEPVQLLLPPSVRALKIYREPIPLSEVLPHSMQPSVPAIIEYEPMPSLSRMDDSSLVDTEVTTPSLLPPALEAFAGDSADDPERSPSEQDRIDEGWGPAMVAAPTLPPPTQDEAPAPKVISEETVALLRELEATRGPKPLAVIERLYAAAYLPLQRAMHLGQAPDTTQAVLDEWSTSFAKSYKEAFEALRLRGRRPRMVMDLPEIAQRLLRLHGARSAQLLMVDAMRFDLGQRINERLQGLLSRRAACAEQLTLWSGLPATTATQLELLGRGQNALQEFTGEIDDELVVNRERTAGTIRRIRTGHRELLKLDLIEAKLVGPGAPSEQRLDEIASEVASVLAGHIDSQPSGTLVMLFGDHGFVFELDERGHTTGIARPSARVEEVLVPAYAWLAGGVH